MPPPLGYMVTNIRVGNNPHALALSPDGARLYVANAGENTGSVISVPGG